MPSAFDFARVPGPSPTEILDAGGVGVLTYSFRGQTDAYLNGIRFAGLKSVWIWERNTDSIFNGYDYAVSECRLHEARAMPGELTYVACDTNDGGVAGRQLAPFLQGWSDTTREACFGVYGSSGAIRQAKAFGGKCQRYWGVVNWINGGGPNNAPQNISYWTQVGAHLIQMIGSPIPGTDENMVLKPDWGTIGAAPPSLPTTTTSGGSDMNIIYSGGPNGSALLMQGNLVLDMWPNTSTNSFGVPDAVVAYPNPTGADHIPVNMVDPLQTFAAKAFSDRLNTPPVVTTGGAVIDPALLSAAIGDAIHKAIVNAAR